VNTLEEGLLELHVAPVRRLLGGQGITRAVCPRCVCERWVTADGRFTVHDDDNGAWCNGSREAVRT
jgi:hypothetical protein